MIWGIPGLVVGSFLNVVIHRLPRGESIAWPSSRCPHCSAPIRPFDNIPLLSWCVLRGRCRQCRQSISWRYPVIEAGTAVVFMAVAHTAPDPFTLAHHLVYASVLIALLAIDFEHYILPDELTLGGLVAGLAGAALTSPSLRVRLVGAALGAAVPLGIALAYRRWRGQDGLGMGDVKMLAMMGATTGSAHMLLSLMLATFAGAAVGIFLLTLDGRSLQRPLPFGTFLSLAGLVSLVSGDAMIRWYLGLML
jgi:leader peptidase (prepilin peptidase)/N-methyltransferase